MSALEVEDAHVVFRKIPRLQRDIVITEKIDGTNAQVLLREIVEPLTGDEVAVVGHLSLRAGSRNRWLLPGKQDNFGFAAWVLSHAAELAAGLGTGRHFGEWWGQGIQRGYGLDHRRFSLFNVSKWAERDRTGGPLEPGQAEAPGCCHVVPVLYQGPFEGRSGELPWTWAINELRYGGSKAAPGYLKPEGIVVFHEASGTLFKQTLEDDEKHKGWQPKEVDLTEGNL